MIKKTIVFPLLGMVLLADQKAWADPKSFVVYDLARGNNGQTKNVSVYFYFDKTTSLYESSALDNAICDSPKNRKRFRLFFRGSSGKYQESYVCDNGPNMTYRYTDVKTKSNSEFHDQHLILKGTFEARTNLDSVIDKKVWTVKTAITFEDACKVDYYYENRSRTGLEAEKFVTNQAKCKYIVSRPW